MAGTGNRRMTRVEFGVEAEEVCDLRGAGRCATAGRRIPAC